MHVICGNRIDKHESRAPPRERSDARVLPGTARGEQLREVAWLEEPGPPRGGASYARTGSYFRNRSQPPIDLSEITTGVTRALSLGHDRGPH